MAKSAGATLRSAWNQLSPKPMGKVLFSAMFTRLVPYAGSIRPMILDLSPGHCRVQLKDHKKVRNHLNSVHAVALMNLGEMTSGMALAVALPDNGRSILTNLSMDYLKKARGVLTSECRFEVPDFTDKGELELVVDIKDEAQEVVARAKARWLVDRKG